MRVAGVSVAGSWGSFRIGCLVELFVDLVERTGCALGAVNGCFALGSVGGGLCPWRVVESYILGELLYIVQSP